MPDIKFTMVRIITAVFAIVSIGCLLMLILSPMDRVTFLITNSIGKWLFPNLDHFRRQQKLKFFAGTIFISIVTASSIYFLLKVMNRHPRH